MFGSPAPLPVPANCPVIVPNQIVTAAGAGVPLIFKFVLPPATGFFSFFQSGSSVSTIIHADNPINGGWYGPNPTILGIKPGGGTTGRMRLPKLGQPDAQNCSCQGDFAAGTYYLVIRSGDNGAPVGNVVVSVHVGGWVI